MVTGAVIAAGLNQPVLALPLAFASHFVLDSLPHFGYKTEGGLAVLLRKKFAYLVLAFEIAAFTYLVATLWAQPWWYFLFALLAASPDSVMFYRYFFFELRHRTLPKLVPISRFHKRIQWGERPWGFAIEIAYYILMVNVLKNLIK